MAEGGRELHQDGQLSARPRAPGVSIGPGMWGLGIGRERDGRLYVPAGYDAASPAPFVLMLHGSGGRAQGGLAPFAALADAAGTVLLSVDSRAPTWDVIRGDYGPDVAFIDAALRAVFDRVAVDPDRVAVEGFSDGASYALSLGMMNGGLFTHVIAFSPGFVAPRSSSGNPAFFVSHGTGDAILPVACSRRIVPKLEEAGYDVLYREFDGGHLVPPPIAREALDWFTASPAADR